MAKLKYNEQWVSGLSDCCDAPLKEVGQVFTLLICSECGELCNKKRDDEDDILDDFIEDDN